MNYPPAQSRKQYLLSHIQPSNPPDEEVCPICFDEWDPKSHEVVKTICGHVFHLECLTHWLETMGNTCPNCRSQCFPKEETATTGAMNRVPNSEPFFHQNIAPTSLIDYIENTIEPLLELDEILEQHGIDLEDESPSDRFSKAMNQVILAGVALCRFPANLEMGFMPILAPRLRDWQTIKFLIATLFIKAQWPLMSPEQWANILAERNTIYCTAQNSQDFGANTQQWLDSIYNHRPTLYVAVDDYWPDDELPEVSWTETNAAGNVIKQGRAMSSMLKCELECGPTYHLNFSDTEMGPRPTLIFMDHCLLVSERVVGGIADFSVIGPTKTVIVRSSTGHMMTVQFD